MVSSLELVDIWVSHNDPLSLHQIEKTGTARILQAPALPYWLGRGSRLERTKLTSLFVINRPVEIDSTKGKLIVRGTQRLWADTHPQDPEEKTYLIEFKVTDGRFQVVSLSERQGEKQPASNGEAVPQISVEKPLKEQPAAK